MGRVRPGVSHCQCHVHDWSLDALLTPGRFGRSTVLPMRRCLRPCARFSSSLPARQAQASSWPARHHTAAAAATPSSDVAPPPPTPPPSPTTRPSAPKSASGRVDPYELVGPELQHVQQTLFRLVGSAHPSLADIAQYYFLQPSKQVRPLIVLLMARATNGLGAGWQEKRWAAEHEHGAELDRPLTRPDVLNDANPNMADTTSSFAAPFPLSPPAPVARPPPPPPHLLVPSPPNARALATPGRALPTQLRLAQIVEMIHVASLLHDDVIDASPLRRGQPSAPAAFGPKLAVLGGDFLLGRASAALARLGEHEVTELIATVVANLVEGEIMQLGRGAPAGARSPETWNGYLRKTYLKTATLMAKGARAAVVLGGGREGELYKEVAYAYGRNLGIAFQVRACRQRARSC
jgi:hexaprenyl-diphosphate synthase